jgi:acyl-CoA thioesterase-1
MPLRRCTVFLIIPFVFALLATPAAGAEADSPITIVAMGDSLTEGLGVPEAKAYPAVLERNLQKAGYLVKVINAGISGETSAGALSRAEWILRLKPDILILETGANDGFRGVDPEAVKKNIAAIIRILQKRDVVVVLAGMKMVKNLGEDYVRAFEDVYPKLAVDFDVVFIPFFLEGVAGDPALNREDGIHPNADGYRKVADHVQPYVEKAIERWRSRKADG